MNVQFVSNEKGKVTAVQVPIKEWDMLKQRYPDIENLEASLPEWQKELLDERLAAIKKNPSRLKPIEGLLAELDR